ncbi:MAG TPA: YgiQ family radical SAM protein [Candidatus Coprenecus stercoravium]|uniref:YgiQ family radical SAM protein n=1 Tax=Candidatus Coprenecus stercoravium TaxID=2840735 RepID=A0A9D2KAM9_9BACT|nr:YgiQ family radical SAM protein [Candidatus Coprenecus stercoravium]
MFPTSVKEAERLGWDYIDIIIFSGDAFIDHPSSGTAMIARVLQKEGYRVAVVPQPNWQDDLRDFRKLGRPRLFFGVNSGAMDSMVNHYTAAKRLRSDDAYTPGGKAGHRPDYAVTVYTRILKRLYPDVPVVIGGIEASLRRLAHYDYWQDRLFPSVLLDSGADCLIYGMGERPVTAVARAIEAGRSLRDIPQTAFFSKGAPEPGEGRIVLNSFDRMLADKDAFIDNFNVEEREANRLHAATLIEPYSDGYVQVNPPFPPETTEEIDSYYGLPFTKQPHPRYRGKDIPAWEMIKNSVTIHRGCFGGCSFCTIAAHQGKFIRSRSEESIVREIERLTHMPHFKGVVSDVGAPTANMYGLHGRDGHRCSVCSRKSCLFPSRCPNMEHSHRRLLQLYRRIMDVPGVRKAFIGSGIRYDLFLDRDGFLDEYSRKYLREVVVNHTSGWFKVAPEHTEDHVLKLMSKPSFELFAVLRREFDRIAAQERLPYRIVPYFISSHPGCTLQDMKALSKNKELRGIRLEQVQDFTPTPMTASSVMFYTGKDLSKRPVFVERDIAGKKIQKSLFFRKNAL